MQIITMYGLTEFLFNPSSPVWFFAKAWASPAGCIQAAVTLQRFRGLWPKRWTQGSLMVPTGGRRRSGGGFLLNPLCSCFTLQTLGGTGWRKDPQATIKLLLTTFLYPFCSYAERTHLCPTAQPQILKCQYVG